MPKPPWTARQDVSPEDASLDALLAGNEPPAEAGTELRPVADVLATLAARPGGDELAGLGAAQAEFRHHVVVPAQTRRSRRRHSAGLASRLGVRLSAATAVVIMGLGGAAAAGYAGALPSSWQRFAHATIGAPAHGAGNETRAVTGAARSAAHPSSSHPAHQVRSGGRPARHRFSHHTGPSRHARPSAAWPFLRRFWPPAAPAEGRWPPVSRRTPAPLPSPTEPVATPTATPVVSPSNAGGVRVVS